MSLTPSQLIYCKRTKTRGRGVFARCRIEAGQVIEEVPVIVIPVTDLYAPSGTSILANYVFHWREGYVAMALGFGALYNHSYTPNAACEDLAPQTKRLTAIRTIERDEEITFNYAGHPDATDDVGFDVVEA